MQRNHPVATEISFWTTIIGFGCLIAYFFCEIDATSDYSWYSGIWHGLCMVPNFILSLFTDHIVKSANGTLMYDIFFWVSGVGFIAYMVALQIDDMKHYS